MSDLNIKELKLNEAKRVCNLAINKYDITLKIDGSLIYYIDGKLFSPRVERTQRYKHIAEILKQADFPNCMGEIFLDESNSNVFDVSKKDNWNKLKFMPFDLIDSKNKTEIYDLNLGQRQVLLNKLVSEMNNPFIVQLKRFTTFDEGWNYCLNNNSEGLIMRNDKNWYKWKLLKEEKVEIVAHEVGKDKGTFILKNGSRLSGTSVQYVEQFSNIQSRGNKAIAECEFTFYTKDGKMFQPRLRQIVEVEK